MNLKEPARLAITASLIYSAWLVYKCPCDTLVACQRTEFYLATLAPVIAIAVMNVKNPPSLK